MEELLKQILTKTNKTRVDWGTSASIASLGYTGIPKDEEDLYSELPISIRSATRCSSIFREPKVLLKSLQICGATLEQIESAMWKVGMMVIDRTPSMVFAFSDDPKKQTLEEDLFKVTATELDNFLHDWLKIRVSPTGARDFSYKLIFE